MKTFFSDADLATCFERLTDYAPVLKGAYRTAGQLLRETVCRGRHGFAATLADLRAQTGISEPTIKDHLKVLHKLGVFFSHEYGQGGHKERMIILGSPEGLQFLAEYSGVSLPTQENPPEKNLGANDSTDGLPEKNFGVPKENLGVPENFLGVKESSYTRTRGSDLIRTDLLKSGSDQIRDSKVSESVQAEALLENPLPPPVRQLSFRANLMAAVETLIQLNQWLSANELTAESPAEPAAILPFDAAPGSQPEPAALPQAAEPAPAPQMPAKPDNRPAGEKTLPAGLSPICQRLAEFGRSKLGVDIQFNQETDGDRRRKEAVSAEQRQARQPEQKIDLAEIARLQAIGIETLVRDLHERCIIPGQITHEEAFSKHARYESERIQFLIEDLGRSDPRLLLMLQPAFEQALAHGGYSVASARKNLSDMARSVGISFAARRDKKYVAA